MATTTKYPQPRFGEIGIVNGVAGVVGNSMGTAPNGTQAPGFFQPTTSAAPKANGLNGYYSGPTDMGAVNDGIGPGDPYVPPSQRPVSTPGSSNPWPDPIPGMGAPSTPRPVLATAEMGATVGYNPVGYDASTWDAAQAGEVATYDPKSYQATQFDVAKGTAQTGVARERVVQPNETVQYQLQQVLDSNSPLIQRARAKAMDAMNARGLINSSMAIGAADGAMYDAALPIAEADAKTYAETAADNQADYNSMVQFNVGELNTMERKNVEMENEGRYRNAYMDNAAKEFNTQEANDALEFGAKAKNERDEFNVQQANYVGTFNVGEQNKAKSAFASAQNDASRAFAQDANAATRTKYTTDAQMNAEIYRAENGRFDSNSAQIRSIMDRAAAEIAIIQRDPNLDGPAKARAIQNITDLTNEQIRIIESVNDVHTGAQLDFRTEFPAEGSASSSSSAGSSSSGTPTSPVQSGSGQGNSVPGTGMTVGY